MTKNKRNKVIALTTAVLLIVALAAMGTIAWLTATDSVDNTFTVGTFNKPDTTIPDEGDPDLPDPVDPDNPSPDKDNQDLDGYIVEPSWFENEDHKILPGESFYKDPYVGTGDGSEAAAVYVYVENPFENGSVYFKMNSDWEAINSFEGKDYANDIMVDGTLYYTGGLFRYAGPTGGSSYLVPQDGENAWTSQPVFNQIIVADDVDANDLKVIQETNGETGAVTKQYNNITVNAFLHQVYEADDTQIDTATMTKAAIDTLKVPEIVSEP